MYLLSNTDENEGYTFFSIDENEQLWILIERIKMLVCKILVNFEAKSNSELCYL